MFFRPRIFPVLLVGFFAMMLIGGMRQASYRNAYFDGYRAGQVAAQQVAPAVADGPSADAAPGVNQAPFNGPGSDYAHPHRHGIGFFGFLFYLILFSFLFKALGRMAWGGGRRHWRNHYHSGRHGPWNGGSKKERHTNQDNDEDDNHVGFGRTYDM